MPRMPESENYDDEEVWLIPCDCQDNHYFKLVWWGDDPDMSYASLDYVRGNPGWGWWGIQHRVKSAFKAFSGSDYSYANIMLNPRALQTLQEFLDARKKD